MPKVSVIIPNYNHARFLRQRIDSVLSQAYQDFEVIILDDCSTDNSRQIIEKYGGNLKISNIQFNEVNTGNTFQQWEKGIKLATGKYIWIAESDDYCDSNFLEIMVGLIENSDCSLAYCKSIRVDEKNDFLDDLSFWYDEFSKDRWKNDYKCTGREEIKNYLAIKNTIPNASAVVFKKPSINEIDPDLRSYRLSGDWLFWIKILQNGSVCYSTKTTNYFRTHPNSVRRNEEKKNTSLEEKKRIHHYLNKNNLLKKTSPSLVSTLLRKLNGLSLKAVKE